MKHVVVARLDNMGDVLLAGPCVRAVAAGADRVTMLAGPHGTSAARMLPGVDKVVTWCAPWIDLEPAELTASMVNELVTRLTAERFDAALVLTSFHQSPLPLAMVLRMAGVPWIGAYSEDYPGSLLDLRQKPPDDDIPEALRALRLAESAGFALPEGDDGRLAVREPLPDVPEQVGSADYVVMHPGASVPARQMSAPRSRQLVKALTRAGFSVVVTGAPSDSTLTGFVADDAALDLGGRTSLAELAAVLRGANTVVAPNTGPAHLAAAVGTPVVSLFAPLVSLVKWAPYRVPVAVLGDQTAACHNSRARRCPIPGHPCLDGVSDASVVEAVGKLVAGNQSTHVLRRTHDYIGSTG